MSITEANVKKKIAELTSLCKLDNFYYDELRLIIHKIYQNNYHIKISDVDSSSDHFLNRVGSYIQVGIKDRKCALHIIWSILHEYGHTLQVIPDLLKLQDPCNKLKREIEAWEFADKELVLYPNLSIQMDCYENYKQDRLNSYQKKCKNFTLTKP